MDQPNEEQKEQEQQQQLGQVNDVIHSYLIQDTAMLYLYRKSKSIEQQDLPSTLAPIHLPKAKPRTSNPLVYLYVFVFVPFFLLLISMHLWIVDEPSDADLQHYLRYNANESPGNHYVPNRLQLEKQHSADHEGDPMTGILLNNLDAVGTRQTQEEKSSTLSSLSSRCSSLATTPVIGVLALPYHGYSYYVAASYIKWLESAGARTIIIPYFDDNETSTDQKQILDDLFSQIQLIFLPGGAAPYPKATLNYLLDKVVEHNQRRQGSFFPVWGTCLGFEFLIEYFARRGGADGNDEAILEGGFNATNVSLPLEDVLVQDLYRDPVQLNAVLYHNVTMNNHELGISPSRFQNNANLNQTFVITSINHDLNGKAFVSTIEPRKPHHNQSSSSSSASSAGSWLPVYGVQYHPEKNNFENSMNPKIPTIPYESINHSPVAIDFSFHMAQFVVNLARQSQQANPTHCYSNFQLYPPVYTYPIKVGAKFEQVYIIPNTTFHQQQQQEQEQQQGLPQMQHSILEDERALETNQRD